MKNIFLIEDHDEALKVWRQKRIKNFDLVHVDAHIDFGFHQIRPIDRIIEEVRSLKELKRSLEAHIAFKEYEQNLDKQTNIGNYIYPAMEEERVCDFYWVVPGGLKEFKKSHKFIKNILRSFTWQSRFKPHDRRMLAAMQYKQDEGVISANLWGRKFVICTLEKLPILRQKILLDIDTDFLVIDSLVNASNAARIGKRNPWILPAALVKTLKKKVKQPEIITIAYSVNGGWTPIKYKHLGEEIAYNFNRQQFAQCRKKALAAADYFNLFTSRGKKKYYYKAVKLNPSYRASDNNYGPLYLSLRKFSKAKREFLKILKVDPKNSACLYGLGNIALEKKDFSQAKKYFSSALKSGSDKFFTPVRERLSLDNRPISKGVIFGLGRAEFGLGNFKPAKRLLMRYQRLEPLGPLSYYLLARIFEKEKEFNQAVSLYKDAMRLGFNNIEVISRILAVSSYLKEKGRTLGLVRAKYEEFKKRYLRAKKLSLKKGKKIKGSSGMEKKMVLIEKRLKSRICVK